MTTQTRAAGATTWVTGASARLTMHRDALNSVSAETFIGGDNSNALARRTVYAPYGETLASAAWHNAPSASKGWIGERAEPDAGLIYLNARWYDPPLSRFTRPDKLDPIIPGVGPDQYGYAGGDPVNNSDPGGKNPLAGGVIPVPPTPDSRPMQISSVLIPSLLGRASNVEQAHHPDGHRRGDAAPSGAA